jgi:LmbE family N-acetylglucosaminyl deacetylase
LLSLDLLQKAQSFNRILCLGAHSDDIEIGCGGTVLKLLELRPDLEIWWVVFGSDPQRAAEASASADLFLENAEKKRVFIRNFRDGFFPYIGSEIKDYFEQIKRQFVPDLIFTHTRHDLHQDHRVVCELTWNTFRNHFILEYEIPKYDGDLGSPNCFVHLSEPLCRKKIDCIQMSFQSQKQKPWFAEDTFLSLLRLRGIESRSPGKYAEAFYCRKMVLG